MKIESAGEKVHMYLCSNSVLFWHVVQAPAIHLCYVRFLSTAAAATAVLKTRVHSFNK